MVEAMDLLGVVQNASRLVGRRQKPGAVEADAGEGNGHIEEVAQRGRKVADVRWGLGMTAVG